MKIKDPTLLSCWPDGFSRYYSVSNILRIVYGEEKTVRILDVGGDSQWMAKFLDNVNLSYELNIVDTRKPDFKSSDPRIQYTRADFFKIKPQNFPSEAVINTDVLEHIPPDLKIAFVNQCLDFAQSLIIFSAPQDDDEVTLAEHQINDYYKSHAGKQQRWLKEHFEFGKPNSAKIEAAIKKRGLSFIAIDTNNLDNWLSSFSLNFINSEVAGLKGMDELNRYYNEHIHTVGDFSGKPYRRIFIVFKDAALYEEKEKQLRDFFKPDSTKKVDFLCRAFSLVVSGFIASQKRIAALNKEHELLQQNLHQTQAAFVAAKTELDAIKASKTYRYATKLKKTIGR